MFPQGSRDPSWECLYKKVVLWFYLLSFTSLKQFLWIYNTFKIQKSKRTIHWTFCLPPLSAICLPPSPQARIVNGFYYYSCVSFQIVYACLSKCMCIFFHFPPFCTDNSILHTFCTLLFSFGIFWSLFIFIQKIIPFLFKVYSNSLHGNTIICLTSFLLKGI